MSQNVFLKGYIFTRMLYKLFFILSFFMLFVSCQNNEVQVQENSLVPKLDSNQIDLNQYKNAEHLINIQQLLKWQADTVDLVVLDVRKKEAYRQGHLINAHQVWRPDIRSTNFPYKGMMLEKEALEDYLGKLGASKESKIVVYDAKGNVDAARLWWLLAYYGHKESYILNGGLLKIDRNQITSSPSLVQSKTFRFADKARPELLATKKDVLNVLNHKEGFLLDCRTEEEFSGQTMKKGAFRAGRIPGSVRIEHSEAIAFERSNTFRDYKDLARRFATVPKDKQIIVYCQSGTRSAHTTFVLRELLGYPNVSNYDGSWIEWSYFEELPILTAPKES